MVGVHVVLVGMGLATGLSSVVGPRLGLVQYQVGWSMLWLVGRLGLWWVLCRRLGDVHHLAGDVFSKFHIFSRWSSATQPLGSNSLVIAVASDGTACMTTGM